MEGRAEFFEDAYEQRATSIDDLAARRFIARRSEYEGDTDGPQRARYERARAAFESSQGKIVREVWGSQYAVGLVLTMRAVQRRSPIRAVSGLLPMGHEVRFELHRAVGSLAPTDFVIAFAHGDELAARASTVLRSSSAQRVVLERLFAAQALLVSALDEFGPEWIEQERSPEPHKPSDFDPTAQQLR